MTELIAGHHRLVPDSRSREPCAGSPAGPAAHRRRRIAAIVAVSVSAAMLGALPAGAQAPNAQVPRAQVTEPPLYRLAALLDPSGHTIRAE